MSRSSRGSANRARWIVKAGSNVVCSGGPLLIRAWMKQVRELRAQHGVEVVWVTSGAIATATERTSFRPPRSGRTLAQKQALSAIGQPLVMDLYDLALAATGMLGAQVLLTYDDLVNPKRRGNFRNTIEQLLTWGVTPILNENDAVATEEIRFGDNDSLSAKVARVLGAQRLVILTDVDGLYDSDPRLNPAAELLHHVSAITPEMLRQTSARGGSQRGTGGMYSKLRAASEALRGGIEPWLARGDEPHVLERVAQNEILGTRFGHRRKARRAR